jgi:hypothetical protein
MDEDSQDSEVNESYCTTLPQLIEDVTSDSTVVGNGIFRRVFLVLTSRESPSRNFVHTQILRYGA